MRRANCFKIAALGIVAGFHVSVFGQIDPDVKPAPDRPKPIRIGEFHSFVADNGLKVFLVRRADYPKFRISIDANLPSVFDEQEPELRDILGALQSAGNRKYRAAEVSRIEKHYAATISVSPRTLVCAGMKEHADRLMPVAAAYYTTPSFDSRLVDSLVAAKIEALSRKKAPHKKSISDNVMGYLMDSLRFARELNPNNASCMLIGDFTIEEANRFVCRYFKGWKRVRPLKLRHSKRSMRQITPIPVGSM